MGKKKRKVINPLPPEARSRLMTSNEIRLYFGGSGGKMHRNTLAKYRAEGMPIAGKVGNEYRYDIEEVAQWFKARYEEYVRQQKAESAGTKMEE